MTVEDLWRISAPNMYRNMFQRRQPNARYPELSYEVGGRGVISVGRWDEETYWVSTTGGWTFAGRGIPVEAL